MKIVNKQEYILVGCVSCAVWAGVCPGGCLPGGVCPGVYHSMHWGRHSPLPVDRMTNRCKNITFPQLRLRTVKICESLLRLYYSYLIQSVFIL